MEKTQSRKFTPWEKQFIDFVMASPEGRHMLEKVAKSRSTKLGYSIGCKYFSDFLKKGLTEIVNEYREDVKRNMYEAAEKWEPILDDFAIYLQKLTTPKSPKGYASSTIVGYHAGAKALINANVPRSMQLKAKTPDKFSRTIAGVTLEDLKAIYGMVDPREKAIIAFLKDTGISRADAILLNIEDLKGFEKGELWLHLQVYRGKEHVEYETFAGPNTVEALKPYFALREQKGEKITSKSPLFMTSEQPYNRLNEVSLSTILKRVEDKTGKTISSHRLRKFFETYMALTVRHPIILKYWMGHEIRKGRDIEARYIIPPTPEQLELYKQAYKNIDLTQAGLEERVKAMEKVMETMTPEQRELIQRYGLRLSQKSKKPKTETNGGQPCEDGEHCGEAFEQISETQLLSYLKDGWQIVHKLGNGDLIVKRS